MPNLRSKIINTGTTKERTKAARLRRRLAKSLPRRVSKMRMGMKLLADGTASKVKEERFQSRTLAGEEAAGQAERLGERVEGRKAL